MIIVRYAICSERQGKPVTRMVVESRVDADNALEQIREQDRANPETTYWIAELGSESESWRWLAPEAEVKE
ncbi:MAG: hypothetical protein JW841_06435 [Deltaproteobacteria bacterium]|nr:hypothetical protein [Deltaproteobacteria bacterium]